MAGLNPTLRLWHLTAVEHCPVWSEWLGQDVLPGAMAAPSYVHFGHEADTPHEPALSEIYVRLLPSAQICNSPLSPDCMGQIKHTDENRYMFACNWWDSVVKRFIVYRQIPQHYARSQTWNKCVVRTTGDNGNRRYKRWNCNETEFYKLETINNNN